MSQLSHKITICGKCKLNTCGECEIKVFGKCDVAGCKNEGHLIVIEHGVIGGAEDYTAVCKKCATERNKELKNKISKNKFMKKTKIDWTDYSWNPVIGCKNNCHYCYAKSWAKKCGISFEPHWSNAQYKKPYKIKEPSKIFVCSLADLFGDWIPNEWIEKVLKVVKDNPQHAFQFLTKNPKKYLEFEFPKNCWLGTTVDFPNQERIDLLKRKKNYKFISFEPLLGDMSGLDLSGIDLAIVGAMTGPGAIAPKKEWIASIKHQNIFYKKNIKKYL